MGSSNGSSNLKNFTYSSRQLSVSPFSYLHVSSAYSDSNLTGPKENSKSLLSEGVNHHQRCSSESFFIEDQPSWLEELLSEPETVLNHSRGHRRSASESYTAYLGAPAANESFNSKEETKSNPEKNDKEDINVQSIDHASVEKANSAQAKSPPASKTDSKRAKQQSAHRSRVRKLKYIAELERTVQLLQAEGSEIQAELEFINQQNLILSMENRALRQRLDGLSQEQLIKHFEQEMLERELARLQTLYQLQSQQQLQMQQPQMQQHSKHHRSKSRDLESQFANLSLKNKEVSSSRGPVTSTIRI